MGIRALTKSVVFAAVAVGLMVGIPKSSVGTDVEVLSIQRHLEDVVWVLDHQVVHSAANFDHLAVVVAMVVLGTRKWIALELVSA